ncbi:MAG: hypothetical protein AB7O92_01630 [Acidimicrobiia bacterium]
MTSPTSARPSSPAVRPTRSAALAARLLPLLAVAAVVGSVVRTGALETPAVVTLQLANPSVYAVTVEVSPPGRERWLPVATLGPGDARTVRDVVDPGPSWRIRLRSQGVIAADLAIERGALEAAGWRFSVPAGVEAGLQAAAVPPSPPDS